MSESIAIEARLDAATRARAEGVLKQEGLTLSEALTILLTQTAAQGSFPLDRNTDPAYDAWVRAKVQEALDDESPDTPHEAVQAYLLQRQADLLRRVG